ncbi:MAG: Crossover junction endodeoxyribonuclease RuvC [candidate division TM6 bacterium GW2011_GWF2_43_17]|nr:MAG: Crossover junction endodeoxyribonuclease RuvC [candidate division TM6 bacterium GW2011_GWF2_43_17]
MKSERIVLAVDPGYVAAGYAIVRIAQRRVFLCECNALRQKSTQTIEQRLALFFDFFHEKIMEHGVTDLCLETPFLGKNAQNFLKLGYLRGALLIHSPREIKVQMTGFGGADKDQVARAVARFFPMIDLPSLPRDATDALALAFCVVSSPRFG